MAVVPLLRAPPAVPGGSWDQTQPESAAREAPAESTALVLTLLKRPRTPQGPDCTWNRLCPAWRPVLRTRGPWPCVRRNVIVSDFHSLLLFFTLVLPSPEMRDPRVHGAAPGGRASPCVRRRNASFLCPPHSGVVPFCLTPGRLPHADRKPPRAGTAFVVLGPGAQSGHILRDPHAATSQAGPRLLRASDASTWDGASVAPTPAPLTTHGPCIPLCPAMPPQPSYFRLGLRYGPGYFWGAFTYLFSGQPTCVHRGHRVLGTGAGGSRLPEPGAQEVTHRRDLRAPPEPRPPRLGAGVSLRPALRPQPGVCSPSSQGGMGPCLPPKRKLRQEPRPGGPPRAAEEVCGGGGRRGGRGCDPGLRLPGHKVNSCWLHSGLKKNQPRK